MYDNNLFNVDTTGVDKMGGYEVYPSGLYPAMLVTAARKPTKNNDGWFIECVYQFIDGDYVGKKFTSRMNLGNANETAARIAKQELKSLRAATGNHDQESDLGKFVNKPLILNIVAKARKDDPTKAENNLVAIEPYGGQQAAPQQPGLPGFAPQPQAPQFAQPQPTAPVHVQPTGVMPGFPGGGPAVTSGAPVTMQPTAPAFQPQPGGTAPWMQGAR